MLRALKRAHVIDRPTICQCLWKKRGGILSGPGALVRYICLSATCSSSAIKSLKKSSLMVLITPLPNDGKKSMGPLSLLAEKSDWKYSTIWTFRRSSFSLSPSPFFNATKRFQRLRLEAFVWKNIGFCLPL